MAAARAMTWTLPSDDRPASPPFAADLGIRARQLITIPPSTTNDCPLTPSAAGLAR